MIFPTWRGKVRKCSEVLIPGFRPTEWWEGVLYRSDAPLDENGWPRLSPLMRPVHAAGVDWRRVYDETERLLNGRPLAQTTIQQVRAEEGDQ